MLVSINITSVENIERENGDIDFKALSIYSDVEEWDICETWQEVYKTALKEYGRCISKIYVDCKDGITKHIGWVFQKRAKYEDNNNTYLQETWVIPYKTYVQRCIVEKEYAL